MSFLNESGNLLPFTEVLPETLKFSTAERSSLITSRRRMRVTPQTGMSYGSAGAGAGGSQIQFLVADQGGLIDMRSICINYTIQTSGTGGAAPDDGHPFMVVQTALNGQQLDNIQNAPKVTNVEMTLGGNASYYRTAGSFQGFELLSPDGVTNVPSSSTTASITAWGYVAGNQPSVVGRATRPANAIWSQVAGEQRSIPLGLITGLGRMKQYLPVSLLGELNFLFICGQPGDVLFNLTSNVSGDFSLSQVYLTYDVVVPSMEYVRVLREVAQDGGAGLVLPFESPVVQTGGVVTSSTSALSEYSVITARATNHLLRCAVVQIPQSVVSSLNYPSQCCFSHAGLWSINWRVGSQQYPVVAPAGDSDIFNVALLSYGAPDLENGTTTNRSLWANSTNPAVAGTPAVYETDTTATSSTANMKFAYADRCVPCYGFQSIKGACEPLMVDGVSLAGASGSQIVVTMISAPQTTYIPYVITTALKFIKAQGGATSIVGA